VAIKEANPTETAAEIQANLQQLIEENRQLAEKLPYEQVAAILPYLQQAERIFVAGAGRSGLSLKSAAMRLMHLGLTVFVAGETTTPAIKKGDLLIVASGSGTTNSIVSAAKKAVDAGAQVIAFSTANQSPLAELATKLVVIPAQQKQDHGGTISKQYAGSLFEQSILLITDAIFQTLWKMYGTPAAELWKRHANLE
jgi:6-phospho-3-hexuloisomerase